MNAATMQYDGDAGPVLESRQHQHSADRAAPQAPPGADYVCSRSNGLTGKLWVFSG